MTMFSMKPKFNLAEFLAVPANVGTGRTRGAKRRGMQFLPAAEADEKTVSAPSEDPISTERQ